MTQSSIWYQQQKSSDYAELCNALFEREVIRLSNEASPSVEQIQHRLKSLPYYIQRAAYKMLSVESPLVLDIQNATWSAKQNKSMPFSEQSIESVQKWYLAIELNVGLVLPIKELGHVSLDSVDRVDKANQRFRTNRQGWFDIDNFSANKKQLLKPTKKVMMAACAGHCWLNGKPAAPKIPTMRELLLSCSINWRNFKRPIPINAP